MLPLMGHRITLLNDQWTQRAVADGYVNLSPQRIAKRLNHPSFILEKTSRRKRFGIKNAGHSLEYVLFDLQDETDGSKPSAFQQAPRLFLSFQREICIVDK